MNDLAILIICLIMIMIVLGILLYVNLPGSG